MIVKGVESARKSQKLFATLIFEVEVSKMKRFIPRIV